MSKRGGMSHAQVDPARGRVLPFGGVFSMTIEREGSLACTLDPGLRALSYFFLVWESCFYIPTDQEQENADASP
jgi:hypothetical protein